MFKPSLWVLLMCGLVSIPALGNSRHGQLYVNQAESTIVTLYSDKALISQDFNKQPDAKGVLEISGLPINRLDGSLNLEYREGAMVQRPEEISWYQGGMDRDNYYRNLMGKTVEVVGGGLNAGIQGKLVSYQQGIGLVEGDNGRQYFIDYDDPQGLRMLAIGSVDTRGQYLEYLTANFGKQTVSGSLKLSYITPLLNYVSHYRLTLLSDNQGRLDLKALLVNSSAVDFSDAKVRLVAGAEGGASGYYRKNRMLAASVAEAGDYGERVGEVLLTTLPDDTALPANSKQLLDLFSETLHLEKLYTLDFYGRAGSPRASMAERPTLIWKFAAPVDLPPAPVRMYERDSDGGYIIGGNSWLTKTTAGDTAWLTMGEALAVRVERSRIDAGQKSEKEQVVKWQATVANDQKETITLLLRERDPNLLKLEAVKGATLEKFDQIRVDVAAGGQKTIYFTAKYHR